ncbi:MAG: hypothetical protein BGO12_21385 [Verrucomicrobia bacterium 61-8]|nr:hypothetical protein [Verrucomicrobiota bacterium]OJU98048.1 MAG: hypothetical protein BGO12_21385 [Verrucomicrobia bacterium 61-8]
MAADWKRCLDEAVGYLGLDLLTEADEALSQIETGDRLRYEVLATKFQIAAVKKNWWVWDCSSGEPEKIDPSTPEWWIAAAQAARQARTNRDGEVILRMGLAIHQHPEICYMLARVLCSDGQLHEATQFLFVASLKDGTYLDRAIQEEDFRGIWGRDSNGKRYICRE